MMSQKSQDREADDLDEFRDRIDKIIERERDVLDRLA
jgi:FixJ family two-component response regulator